MAATLDRVAHRSINGAATELMRRNAQAVKAIELAKVKSLTFAAKDVQGELKKEITRVIDRPTRFTANSPRIQPATQSRQYSRVYIQDRAAGGTPPSKYLQPISLGGRRGAKGFEEALRGVGVLPSGWIAVPGRGQRLNQFGNLPRTTLSKMIADVKADPFAGRRGGRRGGPKYWVMWRGNAPMGIATRSGRKVRLLVAFRPEQADYQKTFDFNGVSEREANRRLPEIYQRLLRRELEKIR